MSMRPPAPSPLSGSLVITSGDISDVDGFMALARYAQTGADCLFVMNLPRYVAVTPEKEEVPDADYEARMPGLGFRFSAAALQKDRRVEAGGGSRAYENFRRAYDEQFPGDVNRAAANMQSDLAFGVAALVWAEQRPVGRLFYCVGGTNEICPFSAAAIKDEVQTYASLLPQVTRVGGGAWPKFCAEREGQILQLCEDGRVEEEARLMLGAYSRVVMDMNGSAAFARSAWWDALTTPELRVHSLFVMGGVRTDAPLQTSPAIKGVLNRLAGATMNQLYSPDGTARLLGLAARSNAAVYVVSNNAVPDFAATSDATLLAHERPVIGMQRFVRANGLWGPFLEELAGCYYGVHANGGKPGGAAKPFDYFTACAVARVLSGATLDTQQRALWFDGTYALTLLSQRGHGAARVFQDYCALLEAKAKDADARKAASARAELDLLLMQEASCTSRLQRFDVRLVQFEVDLKSAQVLVRERGRGGCCCV